MNNEMFSRCWHHEKCRVQHLRGRAISLSSWCSHQRTVESISTTCSPSLVHHGDQGMGWCRELVGPRGFMKMKIRSPSAYKCSFILVMYLRHHAGHNNNVLPLSSSIYGRKLISSTQEQKNENTHILTVWIRSPLSTLPATKSTQYTASECPRMSVLIFSVFKSHI